MVTNNLQIDLATDEDLTILNSLYADMNNKPLMSEDKIIEIWLQIQQVPDYYVYLAYLDNKAMSSSGRGTSRTEFGVSARSSFAIGTFSLLFMPTMMHPDFHKSAILDSVTILSSYRGQGYGKQMMQRALEISADAGCYKVTLSSNLKRDRTHGFYKSLGFQQHGWSFSRLLSMDNSG